jgi:hypothetical protein
VGVGLVLVLRCVDLHALGEGRVGLNFLGREVPLLVVAAQLRLEQVDASVQIVEWVLADSSQVYWKKFRSYELFELLGITAAADRDSDLRPGGEQRLDDCPEAAEHHGSVNDENLRNSLRIELLEEFDRVVHQLVESFRHEVCHGYPFKVDDRDNRRNFLSSHSGAGIENDSVHELVLKQHGSLQVVH